MWRAMYHRPWNLLVYAIAVVALTIDLRLHTNVPVYFIAVVFVFWDLGYFFSAEAFTGRDADNVLSVVTLGRQYMSWYMAFFGIFFSLLLTGEATSRKAFMQIAAKAQVTPVSLLIPFLFVAMSGLFIPIQLKSRPSKHGSDDISLSLKGLLLVVTFSQKMATFLLAHCIGRLILAVSA